MKKLRIMQEKEYSGTLSMYPSTMQPLCRGEIGATSDVGNSEYDQEIPHSHTADNPVAPQRRAAETSRDTRKKNKAKQSALSTPSK